MWNSPWTIWGNTKVLQSCSSLVCPGGSLGGQCVITGIKGRTQSFPGCWSFPFTNLTTFNAGWVCKGAHTEQLLAVCFRNSSLPSCCCCPAHTITTDKLLSLLIKVARAKVRVQLSLMSRAFPGARGMQGCSLMPAPLRAAAFTLRWNLPGTFADTKGWVKAPGG